MQTFASPRTQSLEHKALAWLIDSQLATPRYHKKAGVVRSVEIFCRVRGSYSRQIIWRPVAGNRVQRFETVLTWTKGQRKPNITRYVDYYPTKASVQ